MESATELSTGSLNVESKAVESPQHTAISTEEDEPSGSNDSQPSQKLSKQPSETTQGELANDSVDDRLNGNEQTGLTSTVIGVLNAVKDKVNGMTLHTKDDPVPAPPPPPRISNSQYSAFVCLKGDLQLQSGVDIFQACEDNSVRDGAVLAVWKGNWAMNDTAYELGNVSAFEYTMTKTTFDFLDDQSEKKAEESVKVTVTGNFQIKLQNPNKPFDIVQEHNLILTLNSPDEGNTTGEVFGTGENKFGAFRLFGTYNRSTNRLHCYREYSKAKPKLRKANRKRKSSLTASAPRTKKPVNALPEKREKKPKGRKSIVEASNTKTEWDDIKEALATINKTIEGDKERWFTQPVDVEGMGLSTYYDIIKKPMDLGTVKSGLESGKYATAEDAFADVRLTFKNAMLFNPKQNAVHKMASMHLKIFERDVKSFEKAKKSALKEGNKRLKEKQRGGKKVEKFGSKLDGSDGWQNSPLEQIKKMQKEQKLRQKKLKSVQNLKSKVFGSSDEDSDSKLTPSASPVSVKKKGKRVSTADPANSEQVDMLQKQVEVLNQQLQMMSQVQSQFLEMQRMNLIQQQSAPVAQPMASPPVAASVNPMNPLAGGGSVVPVNPLNPMASVVPTQAIPAQPIPEPNAAAPAARAPRRADKPVTWDERQRVMQDLAQLPTESHPALAKVLQQGGFDLGDSLEFELDIENMEPALVRKLMRFAKKEIAKMKSKAQVTGMQFDWDR